MIDLDKLIAYENGDLDDNEIVELFQELIHSGDCWKIQGNYGRVAMSLIDAGYCTEA